MTRSIILAILALVAVVVLARATVPRAAQATPSDARLADVVQQLKTLDRDVRDMSAKIDKFGPALRPSLYDQLASICADIHLQVYNSSSTSCR